MHPGLFLARRQTSAAGSKRPAVHIASPETGVGTIIKHGDGRCAVAPGCRLRREMTRSCPRPRSERAFSTVVWTSLLTITRNSGALYSPLASTSQSSCERRAWRGEVSTRHVRHRGARDKAFCYTARQSEQLDQTLQRHILQRRDDSGRSTESMRLIPACR